MGSTSGASHCEMAEGEWQGRGVKMRRFHGVRQEHDGVNIWGVYCERGQGGRDRVLQVAGQGLDDKEW